MKDFLKDVPKLENLPKALYLGVEHYILSKDDYNYAVVNKKSTYISWVSKDDVSPIPELTHWEASDFHKWFAENGMDGSFFKVKGINGCLSLTGFFSNTIYSGGFGSFNVSNVLEIRKNICGKPTQCTKPIKTGI